MDSRGITPISGNTNFASDSAFVGFNTDASVMLQASVIFSGVLRETIFEGNASGAVFLGALFLQIIRDIW